MTEYETIICIQMYLLIHWQTSESQMRSLNYGVFAVLCILCRKEPDIAHVICYSRRHGRRSNIIFQVNHRLALCNLKGALFISFNFSYDEFPSKRVILCFDQQRLGSVMHISMRLKCTGPYQKQAASIYSPNVE